MKSRYCYCPMTAKRIGRRVTILYRIRHRRAMKRQSFSDLHPIVGYYAPIYPGK